MPCRKIAYSGPDDFGSIREWLSGRENPGQNVDTLVRDIIDTVRERGDEALAEYGRKFDCSTLTADALHVRHHEIEAALTEIPAEDMDILREAAANIRAFHEGQKENSWWTTRPDGTILGQMVNPVDRVGLYVPGGQGGQTPLISSLLMNAIPAQVAGVKDIAVVSPPRPDGTLNPTLLATAHMLGITEIYRAGSAWAIAALTYGTQTIRPVDVIAGPGNIFVTTAKRLLTGKVGIDMIAGPSEICILADSTANAQWLAADMLSQAEHDALASAMLVTTDAALAEAVREALAEQLEALPRAEIARKSLADWSAIITCADLATAADIVNSIAPEHLELSVADPWSMLGSIRHAGAIFMGHHAPEPVGDYFAGPNHVLPTLGTARFSSALSVQTFCKKSSIIATQPNFTATHGAKIARLARLEGLEAHARSVEQRLK
ncbi:histidinol dehydrogenase [Desulfobaculum xiamenense]|uniref:Histidinol dehydrogenase n=1 Tax=Desulfobaculum xiamenense TaxID=995050 RepID=A0A846QLG5_9BACT|nr:histidinol dehydrogenase [Desulfobaculum xiamenense]NJB67302.1 histidinol dehydrogenase [Desulfobaculum xiamenense]